MNFSLLTDHKAVENAQQELVSRIRRYAVGPIAVTIGSRSGTKEKQLWYVELVDLWFSTGKASTRWANQFGAGRPAPGESISATAGFSTGFDGSRTCAGAFLSDEAGATWLAHSGKVGGGKKGVGRTAFLRSLTGSVQRVDGHDYVVIGRIEADDFLEKLAAFVGAVKAFKVKVASADVEDDSDEGDDDDDEPGGSPWGLIEILEGVEPVERRILLEWFAEALRIAHAKSKSGWSVTRRSDPRRIRALVGNVVAFEIGRGAVGIGLQTKVLHGTNFDSDLGKTGGPFASVDGGVWRHFSIDRFMELHEDLREGARQFIEEAIANYPNNPYARYHAPDLLPQIEEALGQSLPRPIHRGSRLESYWKVAPGEKGRLWERCRDGGYIAVGWDELGDLTGLDRDGFDTRVDETMKKNPPWTRGGVDQAWRFINIPVGAKIVANDGTKRVLGVGTVTGAYQFVQDGKEFAHRLAVDWGDQRERVVEQRGWIRTVIRLSPATFAAVNNAPSPGDPPKAEVEPVADPLEQLDFGSITDRLGAAGLQFPEELIAAYLLALQAKRFVLLSGISGTGKTQLALEVARAFQPTDAGESEPAADLMDVDIQRIRVMPYMLKYRRLVVPTGLAESVQGHETSQHVTVRFGDGQSEQLRWSIGATATQLLFKGAFRKWFEETFTLGKTLELQLESEDPPALRIAPLDASTPDRLPATYAVVAVRPDWTDNRGLLGYYNPITRDYQTTPFLRLLLAAAEEQAQAAAEERPPIPFFVILDEMNLARVEHYFSDFLSCLESGEPLHLHDDPLVASGASEAGEVIPMQCVIPRNLFFTGTLNVDESTYMFSPKVLDRAFVLEFNSVDLESLGAETDTDTEGSALALKHFDGALEIRDKPGPEDYGRFRELLDGALHRALRSLHQRLEAEHRHFGYRVATEIGRFVGLARTQAGKDPGMLWEALDVAIVAKVLPKLHGTQQELEDVLQRLLAFALDVGSATDAREQGSQWDYTGGRLVARADAPTNVPKLPRSAAKLWRMLRRVRQQGYVSFIE